MFYLYLAMQSSKIVPLRFMVSLFFVVCTLVQASAKDSDHKVSGVVFDSFSEDGLPALITLMTADSVVIDTVRAVPDDYPFRDYPRAADYQFTIQNVGHYIVKAEMEGYIDAYMNFELRSKREQSVGVKPIRMMKALHDLPEVTVKATKIKMVMRGDTIVYTADAFNLAEGSMLDALVSRLPGVRLTKDGEIFVNDKKIESLLINGRDFFGGSPKVALQNLPAYTVSKIKVYDEAGVASRIMQRDMGDKHYMMDVNLKKEYSKTYIGNVESGYGTENRYLAKAFGIKMSDKEWVMGAVNINNLSDNQQIGIDQSTGSNELTWQPQGAVEGLLTNREAIFGYNRFFDRQNWLGGVITLNHSNHDNESRTNSQIYLPDGDSFQRQQSHSTGNSILLKGKFNHHLEKGGIFNENDFSLQYTRNKNLSHSEQTTSDSASVLNEMLMRGSYENQRILADGSISGGVKVIADMLRWGFSVNYDHLTADQFSLNDIQYTNGQTPRDFRNTYLDNGHQNWNVKGLTSYEICWPRWKITSEYEYNYRYNKSSNVLYRMDKLADRDSAIWDMLPSAREVLIDVLDRPNSYDFHEYQNHHRFKLQVVSGKIFSDEKDIVNYWQLQLPLRIAHNNLYYNRLGRHDVRRHAVFFEPNFDIRGMIWSLRWSLSAKMWSEIPDMTTLVAYRDDTNPLNIRLGNPDLRNQHYYSASLYLQRWVSSHQQSYWMTIGYNQQDNAVAYATEFDKNTGISTVQPVSVNGNWNTKASLGFSRALGKAEKFIFDNQLDYNYQHSVDMATVPGFASTVSSIVNNHQFGGKLKLTFRPNDNYEFTIHGGGTYYFINSRREGFENINSGDYQVGFNTMLNLPAKFQFTTDLTMYGRRGYQQREMNTTDWVWNAQLTRSFLDGKLIAKLKGFDILQQLSNTRYAMNAQGRTESWHNGIPHYVMLLLSWQFNVKSKQKNE